MEILIGLVFLGASLAVAFVLPVLSYLRASQATQRTEALAREVQALRAEVAALASAGKGSDGSASEKVTADSASADASTSAEATADKSADQSESGHDPTGDAVHVSPSHESRAPSPESPVPNPEIPNPEPEPRVASAAETAGSASADASADTSESRPYPPESRIPSPDPRIEGLEERIGARWLLYAGIGSLILGLSYFIKFAFDNGWVSEPLRVAIGLAAGGALLGAGQRFVGRGLTFFGHALSGGGLVVLYIALYAALHVYDLIGAATGFAGMLAVTLLGTWLADRHRVQVLGALAVLGGFVTPVLVGGGEDRQVFLFLYNALLLAGALAMVVRHAWAGVAVLAYALAVAMSLAWGATFYRAAAGLRTLLLITPHLLLVAAMVVALRRQRARSPLALPASWVLLSAPLLYHATALWLIGRAQGVLLVYLLLATVAGLSASYHAGWRWARTIMLALVAVPLIDFMGKLVAPRWHTAALVTTVAVYLLHLAGQWRDLSDDDPAEPMPIAEFVHTHATGVFLPVALYVFFQERAAWWNAPMLTTLAAWNLGIAAVLRARMPVLSWQFLALATTIGAVAISEWFDGPVVAIGWALEGAALGHAALQSRNPWLDRGALALFTMSALQLVDSLLAPMAVGTWPIANPRALAALIVVGAMGWLARRAKEAPNHLGGPTVRHTLAVGANVLAIAWLSAEITHVFGERAYAASAAGLPSDAARAELGQQVALSLAWALYAVGLVAAGFRRGYAPARYLAIALFGLTLVKVMIKDIAELDRVYQMLSVLALGALLVVASYLYQRMAAGRVAK